MIFELSEIIKLILNTARNTFTVIYILEKRFAEKVHADTFLPVLPSFSSCNAGQRDIKNCLKRYLLNLIEGRDPKPVCGQVMHSFQFRIEDIYALIGIA